MQLKGAQPSSVFHLPLNLDLQVLLFALVFVVVASSTTNPKVRLVRIPH